MVIGTGSKHRINRGWVLPQQTRPWKRCPKGVPWPAERSLQRVTQEVARKHPNQMPQTPQIAPFDVEEWHLYSESLLNDWTPHQLISAACICNLISASTQRLKGKPTQYKSSLLPCPILVLDQPFEYLIMSYFGLPVTFKSGSQYFLTLMCQAICYSEYSTCVFVGFFHILASSTSSTHHACVPSWPVSLMV